ncbi:MAG: LL-diaminopimelate aminotransferase [Phycisphaerales bacterium]|nr:LL-diaminopimelate aminotransferase [Phycisphaerales bacterium]
MFRVNDNFLKLSAGYLFPEIARRVAAFTEANPAVAGRIIRCGIGDVTEPLPRAAIDAMRNAVDELAQRETFRGYPPPTGYDFVRAAIAEGDLRARGCDIADDEVFLSDGSKPDASAILEILGQGNRVAITDPVYPVYADTNVMAGNSGVALEGGGYEGFVYLPCTAANGFSPALPTERVDVVHLCSPNNPTGTVLDRETLTRWVSAARSNGWLIMFDAAYEAFIRDDSIPHSIYEIEGARECAIEFRSFSKVGGFTGVRAGYTVIPKSLLGATSDGSRVALHGLWLRRWATCSNGVSWPVQCAVAALYSHEGRMQTRALTDFYLANAALLADACERLGLRTVGARNSPYVWTACPAGLSSWETFDLLLREAQVVTTPGAGFGRCGEGFIRISAFNSRANAEEVARRLTVLASVSAR